MNLIVSKFWERYSLDELTPDFAQLSRIAGAFSNLPYENVTKILKDARSITVRQKLRGTEEVLQDHLRWNTGGTCFSLCNALISILENSGFPAFIAMADMHYGSNIHCAVIVPLHGKRYLIDPGYLLHEPMQLPKEGADVKRKTVMNTVIIRYEDINTFSLFTLESAQLKWRYRLHAVPVSTEDFERYWVHSFSLNSMEHVTLSRLEKNGRLYFRKGRLEKVNGIQRIQSAVGDTEASELSKVFGVPADLILNAREILLTRPRSHGRN
jgi:arylamine N-acetyltransferase